MLSNGIVHPTREDPPIVRIPSRLNPAIAVFGSRVDHALTIEEATWWHGGLRSSKFLTRFNPPCFENSAESQPFLAQVILLELSKLVIFQARYKLRNHCEA